MTHRGNRSLRVEGALGWRAAVLAVGLAGPLALFGCERPPEPVDPETGDMCALCKMAITERRHVAEFVDAEGDVFKFDDVGCMLDYLEARGGRQGIAAIFVTDFATKQWLDADRATFVRSPEIRTPMQGGIAAFGDEAIARSAAERFRGTLVRFEELK